MHTAICENQPHQCHQWSLDERKTETIHPLRFALYPASQWELRPSEGQLDGAVFSVVTDSPPETGGSTPQGGGGGQDSLHSCRNEVYDPSSASAEYGREIKLCALCVLCVKHKNSLIFYLTQRPQRSQSYNANYAVAGVVARYARQRTQRDKVNGKVKFHLLPFSFLISHFSFPSFYFNPPPPLRSSHLSQGDSLLQP